MKVEVCDTNKCTGCGMCSNICSQNAISMKEGIHGFVFPIIDQSKCVDCGVCTLTCPSNIDQDVKENVLKVFAAWNKDKQVRALSTSGGVFSVLAEYVIDLGGVVIGVEWNEKFHPQHTIITSKESLSKLNGSKYSQSNTGNIYRMVKKYLGENKLVMFSGTPCQNAALNSFLGREYEHLIQIDVVCHGVPSNECLDKHLSTFKKQITSIHLRKKDPYWDYSYVFVSFDDGSRYKELTINDPYFNLFNIGYSLRNSCHECKYASTRRVSDITLADFWGYSATGIKSINFNRGVSLILVNSANGLSLIENVEKKLYIEESNIDLAKRGNKCLSEPFKIDSELLKSFWHDYDKGMTLEELDRKYTKNTFRLPKLLAIRRLYHKWKWIINR